MSEQNSRPRRGEIRVNKGKGVLVEIGKRSWDDRNPDDEAWAVEEIVTGQKYWLKYLSLGPPLNAMEVIAWAAK